MDISFFAGRRVWFLLLFGVLLLLALAQIFAESSFGAELITLYLPIIRQSVKLCGTIPC